MCVSMNLYCNQGLAPTFKGLENSKQKGDKNYMTSEELLGAIDELLNNSNNITDEMDGNWDTNKTLNWMGNLAQSNIGRLLPNPMDRVQGLLNTLDITDLI